MILQIFLLLMLVFAFLSVQTRMLRNAVIYLGIFSLISAMVYFLYQAPDVGLAEAVIGSTLTTVLYLVSLQKYKVITVYYVDQKEDEDNQAAKEAPISAAQARSSPAAPGLVKSQGQASSITSVPVLRQIEAFCEDREFEMHIVQTTEVLQDLQEQAQHDLIIVRRHDDYYIYANRQNYLFSELEQMIARDNQKKIHLCLS